MVAVKICSVNKNVRASPPPPNIGAIKAVWLLKRVPRAHKAFHLDDQSMNRPVGGVERERERAPVKIQRWVPAFQFRNLM